ncbi:MAG: HNH endonuclease [Candidatus Binatia bacterium]
MTEDQQEESEEVSDVPELDSYTYVRASTWWTVLARDNWTCCSCGRSSKEEGITLEVDHIIPRSRGGRDDIGNLQALCKKCNIGKSNKDATDLRRSVQG